MASADAENYHIDSSGIESNILNDNNSQRLDFIGYLIRSLRGLEKHD